MKQQQKIAKPTTKEYISKTYCHDITHFNVKLNQFKKNVRSEKVTWSNWYQYTQTSIKTWDLDKNRAFKSQQHDDDDDDDNIKKHTNQNGKMNFV